MPKLADLANADANNPPGQARMQPKQLTTVKAGQQASKTTPNGTPVFEGVMALSPTDVYAADTTAPALSPTTSTARRGSW
jgi:hypothetical protein